MKLVQFLKNLYNCNRSANKVKELTFLNEVLTLKHNAIQKDIVKAAQIVVAERKKTKDIELQFTLLESSIELMK